MNDFIKLLIIISAVIILLTFIIISVVSTKKKMKREQIKIDDALDSFNTYLDKKKKHLLKSKDIIGTNEYKEEFKELDLDNIDNLSLYYKLNDLEEKFYDSLNNDKVKKEKEAINLKKKIRNVNSNIIASIKFYNDSLDKYYKIKKRFPSNIVKIFCGFKKYEKIELKRTNNEN